MPVLVCELLGKPEIMMLFRPVEIDLSGAHGLERALHAERSDIDVAQDQGDEQDGHDGMYDLCQLHLRDIGSKKGKQQHKPGQGDRDARSEGKPIDKLLAGIEAAGGSMFVFDKTAPLLDPIEVNPLWKIVLEEDHDDEDEACHEREAGEVVHILCRL